MTDDAAVEEEADSTWAPVDLGVILRGEAQPDEPSLLPRSDGTFLLYEGKVNSIVSQTEAGKTWLALYACACEARQGRPVLYLDFEDVAHVFVSRLRALGVDDDAIESLFVFIAPEDPFDTAAGEKVVGVVDEHQPTLVVIDGITEALALFGFSMQSNDDFAQFMRLLVRPIKRRRAGVLLLDHVRKDTDGRSPIGAQHKLAALDGAAYQLKRNTVFSRATAGRSSLEVLKDRPGAVRGQGATPRGDSVATISFAPHEGGLTVTVAQPGKDRRTEGDTPAVHDLALRERISRYVESAGTEPSERTQRKVIAHVRGRKERIIAELQVLVSEGYLEAIALGLRSDGEPSKYEYRYVRPYRVTPDPPESPGGPR